MLRKACIIPKRIMGRTIITRNMNDPDCSIGQTSSLVDFRKFTLGKISHEHKTLLSLSLELFNSRNSEYYLKLVKPGKHLTDILLSLNDYLKQLKLVRQMDSNNMTEPSPKMEISLMKNTNFHLLRALTSPEQNFSTVEKLANDVLIVLIKQARTNDAIHLCLQLLETDTTVSPKCVSDVIHILTNQEKYLEAERVYILFEQNCTSRGEDVDSRVVQNRLQAMCFSGRHEAAMCIVDQLRASGRAVDMMYTSILKAYMDRGLHARVDELWSRMRTLNVLPTVTTLTIMMDHCAKTHNLDRALQLVTEAVRLVSLDKIFYTSLFRLCSLSQQWHIKQPIDLVPRVLSLMALQQFPCVSWALSQAIQVLCEAGDAEGAEFYYWELVRKGRPPGADVLEMLLEAYSISSQLVSHDKKSVLPSNSASPPLGKLFAKAGTKKAVVVGRASDPLAGIPPLQHIPADVMSAVRQSLPAAKIFEDPYNKGRPAACRGWVAARHPKKNWDLNNVEVPEKLAEQISSSETVKANSNPAVKLFQREVSLYHDLLSYGTAPSKDLKAVSSDVLKLNAQRAEIIFQHMVDLKLPPSSVAVQHLITVLTEAGEASRAMAAVELYSTHKVTPNVAVFQPLVLMYLRVGDRTQASRVVELISERFGLQAPQGIAQLLADSNN